MVEIGVAVRPEGVVGADVSATVFETVTLTPVDVVMFPAASLATAVRVCEPFAVAVVSQVIEYGAVVSSVPRLAPSSLNCTPETPILSEAAAESVMELATVVPDVGVERETEGGVVSGVGVAVAVFNVA